MGKNSDQRSSYRNDEIKNRVRGTPERRSSEPLLNHEEERIRKWLKQVRFRRTVFGGVKETDVWKKIGELNTMYEAALSAERARYDALLEERIAIAVQQAHHQPMSAAEQEKAGDGTYD